jgi:phosphatidylserine synthase
LGGFPVSGNAVYQDFGRFDLLVCFFFVLGCLLRLGKSNGIPSQQGTM